MMARFCAYVEKVFAFGSRLAALRDTRQRPVIPTASVFASAMTMFATARGSLHGLEPDLRMPARLQGLVGGDAVAANAAGYCPPTQTEQSASQRRRLVLCGS